LVAGLNKGKVPPKKNLLRRLMGRTRLRACGRHELPAPGAMKEVRLEGTDYKALLSNVNGTIHATGHVCPHYKAPLVKGTAAHSKP
jgi:nitrite reductase/ring-hydroxylating ferredoxin subunit